MFRYLICQKLIFVVSYIRMKIRINKQLLLIFAKDKLVWINFIVALLLNIAMWVMIYVKVAPTDQSVVLHYNVLSGIDLLGQWYQIYTLPLIGLVLLIFNYVVAYKIYNRQVIFSYFLTVASSLEQIILLVSTFFVILVNI